MLAIQVIHLQWTKASRGAPRARERAAIPRRFLLSGKQSACVIERHQYHEWNDFAPQPRQLEALDAVPPTLGALLLSTQPDGAVQVGFAASAYGGHPSRASKTQAMRIASGEWGRLAINARHVSYDDPWYTETVYLLAVGARIPPNRFLDGDPTHDLDLMADLF